MTPFKANELSLKDDFDWNDTFYKSPIPTDVIILQGIKNGLFSFCSVSQVLFSFIASFFLFVTLEDFRNQVYTWHIT
jgi:hypothetical protein